MRKTFVLALAIVAVQFEAQVGFTVQVPPSLLSSSSPMTPNSDGSSAYQTSCLFLHRYEMLPLGLASINSMSFDVLSGTGSIPIVGGFTVYLQNANQQTFGKPFTVPAVFAGMTKVYAGNLTIPAGAGNTGVTFNAPFSYNGNGLYVAWIWENPGPFSPSPAVFAVAGATPLLESNSVNFWHYYSSSATSPPQLLVPPHYERPALIFTGNHSLSTELEVLDVLIDGKIPLSVNDQTIISHVANTGTAAVSNVSVSLKTAGANTFADTQVLSSLPPGSIQTVYFSTYKPGKHGLSTVSVVVTNPDQIATNNYKSSTQTVTCKEAAVHPHAVSFTGTYGFAAQYCIASKHNFATSQSLSAVKVKIGSFNINPADQMCGIIVNSAGNVIATTQTLNLVSNAVLNFSFQNPVPLAASTDYYIGGAQLSPQANTFGYALNNSFIPVDYYTFPVQGGMPLPVPNGAGMYFGIDIVLTKTEPSVSYTPHPAICSGAVATLSAAASGSILWSTGATNATIVVSPSVTTNYSFTANNGSCISNAALTLVVNECTGVETNSLPALRPYPNPVVNGWLYLNNEKETEYQVLTAHGEVISNGHCVDSIPMTNLPAGMYFVRIGKGGELRLYKVVVL